jgi:hypothetical protein
MGVGGSMGSLYAIMKIDFDIIYFEKLILVKIDLNDRSNKKIIELNIKRFMLVYKVYSSTDKYQYC